jgi:hypothetical protein
MDKLFSYLETKEGGLGLASHGHQRSVQPLGSPLPSINNTEMKQKKPVSVFADHNGRNRIHGKRINMDGNVWKQKREQDIQEIM